MMEGASCLPRLVCLSLPCKRESGTGPVRFDGCYTTAKLESNHRLTTYLETQSDTFSIGGVFISATCIQPKTICSRGEICLMHTGRPETTNGIATFEEFRQSNFFHLTYSLHPYIPYGCTFMSIMSRVQTY